MSVGFQVHQRARAVSVDLARSFVDVPVSTVSDSMNRMMAGGAALRPRHAGGALAGPALTVKTRPGDNLMVHLALDLASPGDVVVVDAGGDVTNAIIGELMVIHAAARGIAGLVIYGAIRDSDGIARQRLPVYSTGITHRGPYKDGPGEINVPIAIDGMVIHPGDLMIGDGDGVLAVPHDQAEQLLAAARAKDASERETATHLAAGTSNRNHILERAIAQGAEFVDQSHR